MARLLSLVALAAAAPAQSPVPLVMEGQVLPGGARVTGIEFVALGAFDGWLVHVTTDDPARPSAVVRDGGVWKEAGDPVSQPDGATVATFGGFAHELFGGVAWTGTLDGTPGGLADDEALYYENVPWMTEGPIGPWPDTDFPDGSRWISFDDVRLTDANGFVLLRGRADDPTVPGPDESYVALGTLCGSVGILCGVERLAQEGWIAPGTSRPIEAVRLSPASAAIAPSQLTLVWSADLEGSEDADGCVFSTAWPGPVHTLLAREGTPSPVPGRTWGALDDPGVDVVASGLWTLRATLDASDPANDALIVKSGVVFVREGDSLPAIAPALLEDFGDGRALLDEAGRVHWYGRWTQGGRPAAALFRDGEILVRTGTTSIGGRRLVALGSGPDDVALSPAGDRLLFKGTLAGGVEGAFLLAVE